jgi:ketosteroid isomerase-like protein
VGEARKVMDRLTDAAVKGDSEALKALYAQDAVGWAPDQGTITGRDEIAAYLGEFAAAFPDASWEELYKHEAGDTAIDEGYFVGTNTGSMTGPNGETIPATGRRVRLSRVRRRDGRERGCHEPPDLLRRAGLAHAARSRARVPGVALGRRVAGP